MRWRSAGLKASLCQAQQRDLKTIAPLSHRPIVLADSIDYRTIGFLHYRPNPSSICYRSYKHSKCCFTGNRWAWSLPVTWQRWRSHHSIRNCRKPHVYANFTTLSFIEPKFYIAGIGNFAFFNSANYYHFCSHPKKDVAIAKAHFLTHYRLFYLVCYRSYTHSKCCFTPNRWAWSFPVTWQKWRSHHSIRNFRKPHAIRKLHDSIFYRTGVIADWSFTLRE